VRLLVLSLLRFQALVNVSTPFIFRFDPRPLLFSSPFPELRVTTLRVAGLGIYPGVRTGPSAGVCDGRM